MHRDQSKKKKKKRKEERKKNKTKKTPLTQTLVIKYVKTRSAKWPIVLYIVQNAYVIKKGTTDIIPSVLLSVLSKFTI